MSGKFVYRITNSQRMALCTLIAEYMQKINRGDNYILPENFIDCSESPDVTTTPNELLSLFIKSDEYEKGAS